MAKSKLRRTLLQGFDCWFDAFEHPKFRKKTLMAWKTMVKFDLIPLVKPYL